MTDLKSFEEIDAVFNKRQYVHFLTLKPPSGVDKRQQVLDFMIYLIKRKISFWIVECDSETEYRHFHGIVSYPDDTPIEDMDKRKASFQRKVNRDIGFCYPLQRVQSIKAVYKYIRGETNQFINEWVTDQEILYYPLI